MSIDQKRFVPLTSDDLREVKADVWDEGRESMALDFTRPLDEAGMRTPTPNPYRQEQDQ